MFGLNLRTHDRQPGTWFHPSRDFEQMFGDFDKMRMPSEPQFLEAACDVTETKDKYLLHVDMPGVAKDDVSIDCTNNSISISAEKKKELVDKDSKPHRIERRYGSIKRTFTLPDGVDPELIAAQYEDGVLSLEIPKVQNQQTKRIKLT